MVGFGVRVVGLSLPDLLRSSFAVLAPFERESAALLEFFAMDGVFASLCNCRAVMRARVCV